MGLTTERKIYLGLIGVAGLALVIDQGLLGPQSAAAESIEINASSISDSLPVIENTPTETMPAAAILIDRIQSQIASDSDGSLGSAFSLTKLIEPSLQAESTIADQSNLLDSSSDAKDSFPLIAPKAVDLPVLTSVMPSKNGGGAVLGGKLLRVGQVGPNGYRLIVVQARAVLVERDGVQYAIEIPMNIGHE